jgi:hypothetical protein
MEIFRVNPTWKYSREILHRNKGTGKFYMETFRVNPDGNIQSNKNPLVNISVISFMKIVEANST